MGADGGGDGADCLRKAGRVGRRRARDLHFGPAMKRIVILISGRGSNMEAIVQRCAEQGWPAGVVA